MEKKLINFTVTKDVISNFHKVAKEQAINKSQLIENFIVKWIKEQNDKKQSTYN